MREIEDSGLLGPEKFSIDRFGYLLCHPYDSVPRLIEVEQPDPPTICIYRQGMMGSMLTFFMENGGRWMVFDEKGGRPFSPEQKPTRN